MKESLRFDAIGPVSLTYKAKEDITIRGVEIPKGQLIYQGLVALNHHPHYWNNPHEYNPDRFITTSKEFLTPDGKKRHPMTYIPFGASMRNCPGQTIGMFEVKFLIVMLLQSVEFQPDPEVLNNSEKSYAIIGESSLMGTLTRNDYYKQ